MVTYTLFSDTQKEIISFNRCATVLGALWIDEPPKYNEWWARDINFDKGTWMLSIRNTKDDAEYMLWDCRNTGYIDTSSIVLSSMNVVGHVPMRYFFWWSLCVMYEYFKLWWAQVQLWYLIRKMYITTKLRPYRSRISRCYAKLRKTLQKRVETVKEPSNPPETR